MYEYINYFRPVVTKRFTDRRVAIAEDFFFTYPTATPADLYRWLWEGEFGPGAQAPELSLDRMMDDIRLARIRSGGKRFPIYESLGLNETLLKINIVPYTDAACPLLRLLMLAERTHGMKTDTLRFKKNWQFMKTQIVPGMKISVDDMNSFENSIAFHMTPELPYTQEFLKIFGEGYRIVPASLFFSYFPEFDPNIYYSLDFA
jgi:hypothetical protein